MVSKKIPSELPVDLPSPSVGQRGGGIMPKKGYLRLGDGIVRSLVASFDSEKNEDCPSNDIEETMKTSDRPITGGEQLPVLYKPGEKPITAADYAGTTVETREEIQGAMTAENDTKSLSRPPLSRPPLSQRKEVLVDPEVLERIGHLLQDNTLAAHVQAYELMKESGIVASERWDAIHSDPEARHNFSKVSKKRVNSFVSNVLHDRLQRLGLDAVVMDLGCGFGNDAKFMARCSRAEILGVDSSETAIKQGNDSIEARRPNQKELEDSSQHWTNRIKLVHGDFFPDLEAWADNEKGLDIIYSHSTLHYAPPLVLKYITFPLIARALTGSGTQNADFGRLCMAMKTDRSASARSPHQKPFFNEDPYGSSFDARDKMFRIYPRSKKRVLALLKPSFDVEYTRVVPVRDYDRKGETEYFCYVIAKPKPLQTLKQLEEWVNEQLKLAA